MNTSAATGETESPLGKSGARVTNGLEDFAAPCDLDVGYSDPDDAFADEALLVLRYYFSTLEQDIGAKGKMGPWKKARLTIATLLAVATWTTTR